MSIEIQIRSSIFQNILTRMLQATLRRTCLPQVGPGYVDHADVAPVAPELTANGGVVNIRLYADLFLVSRDQVVAAPNAVPAGATTSAQRAQLSLDLTASGASVTLTCVDFRLIGPADAMIDSDTREKIKKAVAPSSFDLTAALNSLGLPKPSVSRVEIAGDVIAVRLDPAGGAAPQLHPSQDWGLFLDAATVEQLAKSNVPADRLNTVAPGLTMDAHWHPQGNVPHVDLQSSTMTITMGLVSADITFNADCAFSIQPPRGFHTDVNWGVHVDGGPLMPRFVEKYFENEIAGALDPTKFGGVPTGDRSFAMDRLLPQIGFSGARFQYASALASAAGMTIGGPVTLPADVGASTLTFTLHTFGPVTRFVFCSEGPRSNAPLEPRFVATSANVSLQDAGAVCGCELLAPNDGLQQYVTGTSDGADETRDIQVRLNGLTALGVNQPVQLIVRTARGVRLIDLGIPDHVKTDDNGFVVDAKIIFVDDCMYLPKSPFDHGINWGSMGQIDFLVDPDPIDWVTFAGGRGFGVQLVNLTGLEPGELIQFRSTSHAIDVTADRRGAAVLPVLLRLSQPQQPAFLIRVNRRSLEGRVAMRSTVLERHATLRGGQTHRLTSFAKGAALLHSQFADRVEVHRLGHLGVFTRVERPVHRASEEAAPAGMPCDLPGLVSLVPIPGFTDERVAVALMSDQSKLIVEQTDDGLRVAGVFRGPIGAVSEVDDWAAIEAGHQIYVFSVRRPPEASRPIPRDIEARSAVSPSNSSVVPPSNPPPCCW